MSSRCPGEALIIGFDRACEARKSRCARPKCVDGVLDRPGLYETWRKRYSTVFFFVSQSNSILDLQWTPFSARWYFIVIPTSLSVMLASLVLVLHWLSEAHSGIASGRSSIVGWKYVPIFIAVLYTQLGAMVMGILKRTEPFARMAKPTEHALIARYTLLEKSKP